MSASAALTNSLTISDDFRHFCYRKGGRAWYLFSHEHDVIGKWKKFAELTGCISRIVQPTTHSTLFIATIWGLFFLESSHRYQQRLDKLHTSEMETIARCCQWRAQPLSPAVSCGNDSENTNSSSASVLTIVRKYSHTRVRAALY